MKKGRHRRFEEARALKRGPDIDIESILDDPFAPSPAPTNGSTWSDADESDVVDRDADGDDDDAAASSRPPRD